MWAWLAARVLPGLVTWLAAVSVIGVFHVVSHRRLWQRIARLTEGQTAHLDEKTDAQTRTLQGGKKGAGRG